MLFGVRNDLHPSSEELRIVSISGLYVKNIPPLKGRDIFIVGGRQTRTKVRVWGARGALPVADKATRASGSGRCATQAHRRQGAHRAPQQGNDPTAACGGRQSGVSAKIS